MTTAAGSTPYRSLTIIGVLFFIIGFFTWISGPLITFVQLAFDLDEVNAFLVLMVFYLSYFFLALPAAALLKRTGMKKGLAVGLSAIGGGPALPRHHDVQAVFAGLALPGNLHVLYCAWAGHRVRRAWPATAVPERGIMADSPP